jgi:uncharacterized protein (DUF58 family)
VFLLLLAVFFYRQPFLEMLFLLVLFLPGVSYVVSRASFDNLDVELAFSATESRKQVPAKLKLIVHNPTVFPLLHIECLLTVASVYYRRGDKTTYVLPAPAGGDATFSASVEFFFCGCYEAKITELRCCDYLSLWSFSKPMNARSQIMIYPEEQAEEIEYHPSFYAEGFDEFEAISQKGNASANVTDVREYQPGDRLQKIHWKLSARLNKLMVKESESTASRQFFVLLELYRSDEHPEYIDHAVEHAYAASRELLAHLENFLFAFYSSPRGEFCSFPIRSESDLMEALEQAYYETPYDDPHLGQSVYQKSGMQKGCLIVASHEGVFDEVFET